LLSNLCSKYRRYKPRLIVLFGSRARGDWLEHSDYDVLVVADELPNDPREAFAALYDPEEPLVVPIGIRSDKFLERLRRGDVFLLEIIEDGKIICADQGFLEKVVEVYKRVRRSFARRGRAWIRIS